MKETISDGKKEVSKLEVNTELARYFVDKQDQEALAWPPLMSGLIEEIQDNLSEMFNKLSYTSSLSVGKQNEVRSFYMRIVDNHIEIGVANIEFIR